MHFVELVHLFPGIGCDLKFFKNSTLSTQNTFTEILRLQLYFLRLSSILSLFSTTYWEMHVSRRQLNNRQLNVWNGPSAFSAVLVALLFIWLLREAFDLVG